jgi:hypothetical protein
LPTATALTVRRALPDVDMLVALIAAVRPGEAATVRKTVWENTLPAMMLMLEVPDMLGSSNSRVGFAVIAKSCLSTATVTVMTVE